MRTKKQKEVVAVEKILEKPIHDADYWVNRPINDKHLDWDYPGNWIEGYWQSIDHPHRQMILGSLEVLEPFDSLLELGCSCGPNLRLIKNKYPSANLAGIDVEPRSIKMGLDQLREVDLRVGNFTKLPWNTDQFDVVLCDAVLMYLNGDEAQQCISEITRVAKKAVIVVDRFNESVLGVRNGDVWARNYHELFEKSGFKVSKKKIPKEAWPGGIGWQKFGYVFTAQK